jgi:hypothetical protein
MKKKKKYINHLPKVKVIRVEAIVQAVKVQVVATMIILKVHLKNPRNYKRNLIQKMRKGRGKRRRS